MMSRPLLKRLLIAAGAVVLLVLVAATVMSFLDLRQVRSRIESTATDVLGLTVRIGGRVRVSLLPALHFTLEDVGVLGESGAPVASVARARLWVSPFPLLLGQFRLRRLEFSQPGISIVRSAGGGLNVERLKKASSLLGALDGATLEISSGMLTYRDSTSDGGFEATGCELRSGRIRLPKGGTAGGWRQLAADARIACAELRGGGFVVSALSATARAKDGRFAFDPVTLRLFGGRGTGSLHADVSGPVPAYQVRLALPNFRVEEFLASLSPERAAEGAMDFTASLTMQGATRGQLVETSAGTISLRGADLQLVGHDLDRELSRFESSQGFNLVDVGAVFLAGPLGLAVTKGYNFASLFRGSGGESRIGLLVSDWTIEGGVARATDVALATLKHRIAMRGGLDLVHGRFADVTVAVVDERGCATMRQEVRGPFASPRIEKPKVLRSLAGPVVKLVRQTRALLPAGPCEAFYSGSVAVPD